MSSRLSIQRDSWWGMWLELPSWVGYQSRLGAYGSKDRNAPSDGRVEFRFAPEGRGLEPLNKREQSLISWFLQNEASVSRVVKDGVIRRCSSGNSEQGDDYEFPVIADEQALKFNAGLYAVNVHQLDTGGVPYVGYEFGCEWDEEHGLGVLVHGNRVVEIGFADTAFLLWIAEADAKKLIR